MALSFGCRLLAVLEQSEDKDQDVSFGQTLDKLFGFGKCSFPLHSLKYCDVSEDDATLSLNLSSEDHGIIDEDYDGDVENNSPHRTSNGNDDASMPPNIGTEVYPAGPDSSPQKSLIGTEFLSTSLVVEDSFVNQLENIDTLPFVSLDIFETPIDDHIYNGDITNEMQQFQHRHTPTRESKSCGNCTSDTAPIATDAFKKKMIVTPKRQNQQQQDTQADADAEAEKIREAQDEIKQLIAEFDQYVDANTNPDDIPTPIDVDLTLTEIPQESARDTSIKGGTKMTPTSIVLTPSRRVSSVMRTLSTTVPIHPTRNRTMTIDELSTAFLYDILKPVMAPFGTYASLTADLDQQDVEDNTKTTTTVAVDGTTTKLTTSDLLFHDATLAAEEKDAEVVSVDNDPAPDVAVDRRVPSLFPTPRAHAKAVDSDDSSCDTAQEASPTASIGDLDVSEIISDVFSTIPSFPSPVKANASFRGMFSADLFQLEEDKARGLLTLPTKGAAQKNSTGSMFSEDLFANVQFS